MFKWQTSCVSNAVVYNLLQLWRCLIMKLPLHVKPLIFHWVLGPGSSPHALMSLPFLPSSGQLVVLHALHCHWRLGGSRHSCKDELPLLTTKWLPWIFPILFLWKWEQPAWLHTQILPMCWLHCEWPKSLTCSMLPSCSYYRLPEPPFFGSFLLCSVS